jgi:hypothetical protein
MQNQQTEDDGICFLPRWILRRTIYIFTDNTTRLDFFLLYIFECHIFFFSIFSLLHSVYTHLVFVTMTLILISLNISLQYLICPAPPFSHSFISTFFQRRSQALLYSFSNNLFTIPIRKAKLPLIEIRQ